MRRRCRLVKSDAEATASATRVGSEATVMTACPARVRFLKVSRRRGDSANERPASGDSQGNYGADGEHSLMAMMGCRRRLRQQRR